MHSEIPKFHIFQHMAFNLSVFQTNLNYIEFSEFKKYVRKTPSHIGTRY